MRFILDDANRNQAEKALPSEVIDSDVLFFYLGTKVKQLEREFGAMYGFRHGDRGTSYVRARRRRRASEARIRLRNAAPF
jgi:hypothetical protein